MMKIPCEIYSRVVGYIRPIKQWNEGKKEEFRLRKTFTDESMENFLVDREFIQKTA